MRYKKKATSLDFTKEQGPSTYAREVLGLEFRNKGSKEYGWYSTFKCYHEISNPRVGSVWGLLIPNANYLFWLQYIYIFFFHWTHALRQVNKTPHRIYPLKSWFCRKHIVHISLPLNQVNKELHCVVNLLHYLWYIVSLTIWSYAML